MLESSKLIYCLRCRVLLKREQSNTMPAGHNNHPYRRAFKHELTRNIERNICVICHNRIMDNDDLYRCDSCDDIIHNSCSYIDGDLNLCHECYQNRYNDRGNNEQ